VAVVPKTEREQLGLDPSPEEQEAARQAEEEARAQQEQQAATEQEQEAPSLDWVPEKFRANPEKFGEAYTNLENELRRRGEREREYEQRIAELETLAAEATPQQQGQATDPMLDQYAYELEVAREQGDVRREAQLQAWLNRHTLEQAQQAQAQAREQQMAPQMEVQNEILAVQARDSMARRYEDWGEKEQRIAELIESDPDILPESAQSLSAMVSALDRAYKLASYEAQAEMLAELREQGVTAADVSRAKKLSSQTLSGSTGRPGEPSEADRHLAEMRQSLQGSSWEHSQGA
jgi:hypothetical protein